MRSPGSLLGFLIIKAPTPRLSATKVQNKNPLASIPAIYLGESGLMALVKLSLRSFKASGSASKGLISLKRIPLDGKSG